MPESIALVYIGDGAFWPGVPAKSLTADEVEQYGGEQHLLSTGLYALPKPQKAVKAKSEVKDA